TGHRAGIEQDYPATAQADAAVPRDLAVDRHVGALLEQALDDADDAPAAVIVHRRPLPRQPHQSEQRQVTIGGNMNGIALVALGVGAEVTGLEERSVGLE